MYVNLSSASDSSTVSQVNNEVKNTSKVRQKGTGLQDNLLEDILKQFKAWVRNVKWNYDWAAISLVIFVLPS